MTDPILNCQNCTRMPVCKFVEANKEFAKKMYGMFEYAEWNNIEELFCSNATHCKYYTQNQSK
jgi:hypothetical protein